SGCWASLPAPVLHAERGHSSASSACWRRFRPETPTAQGRSELWLPTTLAGAAALPAFLALGRGATFFEPQSHLPQGQPQPPDTQAHALGRLQLLLQFPQCPIRLLADLLPHPGLHRHGYPWSGESPPAVYTIYENDLAAVETPDRQVFFT